MQGTGEPRTVGADRPEDREVAATVANRCEEKVSERERGEPGQRRGQQQRHRADASDVADLGGISGGPAPTPWRAAHLLDRAGADSQPGRAARHESCRIKLEEPRSM